jgi:ParB family transcriptional regulator, chromosome partitioning protein
MSTKRPPVLGRNLTALLGEGAQLKATTVSESSKQTVEELPLSVLQAGQYQPRREMDPLALQELSESIKAQGIIQPIIVRKLSDKRYEIIAGERRWQAAKLAGLGSIPAIVKQISDQAAIAMALIENIQREDLTAIEEAQALQRLLDEFSLTHEQAAQAVGRSRAAVSNLLRLLGLDPEVKRLLERGNIEMGHARALLSLPLAEQIKAATIMFERGLTVRQAEALVRQWPEKHDQAAVRDPKSQPNLQIAQLQRDLAKQFAAPVVIEHKASGKGKIVVKYTSEKHLHALMEKWLQLSAAE